MALLTADDIRFKRFAPTRLREGYNQDDVDNFLEEVISTVEELTRLAQNAATNTGTFSAVVPVTGEIASSPIVRDLKNDKRRLEDEVNSLKGQIVKLKNDTASAKSGDQTVAAPASDTETQEKLDSLMNDNRELALHLQDSENEVTKLKGELEAVKSSAGNSDNNNQSSDAESAEKIASLHSDLAKLQHEHTNLQNINRNLENEISGLRAGQPSNADIDSVRAELTLVKTQLNSAKEEAADLQTKLQQAQAKASSTVLATADAPTDAANMLTLAQQLHDEVIEKGKNDAAQIVEKANKEHDEMIETAQTKRDELINEGTTKRDELVKEGETKRDELINEAKTKAEETYENLAKERTSIEQKIEELSQFEKDYRKKIVDTLNNMLSDVKSHSE